MIEAAPADILACYGGPGSVAQRLIRIGGVLKGHTGVANHVKIITHQDQLGRWMGIQGQPGGVGLTDCTPDLANPLTRSNHGQPRPGGPKALDAFLADCAKIFGVQYDWVGISMDTLQSVGADDLARLIDHWWRWPAAKDGLLPGHVVCSSAASILYSRRGWAEPTGKAEDRTCTPPQWWDWNSTRQWEQAA